MFNISNDKKIKAIHKMFTGKMVFNDKMFTVINVTRFEIIETI